MRNYATAKRHLFSCMSYSKLALVPTGNQHLQEVFDHYIDNCTAAWIGDLPGVKIKGEAKIANLCVPTTGFVTQLQLGALKAVGTRSYLTAAVAAFSVLGLELGALKAVGTRSYLNAAVAAFSVLGLDVGIDANSIEATIGALCPPPHRMQIIFRDRSVVMWVDDSKATNVEATFAGSMGLKAHKSVVLLGCLAKMIEKTYDAGLTILCIRVSKLEDAVNSARSIAKYGDAIVLSPGCASYDEFKNFEHRGKSFKN